MASGYFNRQVHPEKRSGSAESLPPPYGEAGYQAEGPSGYQQTPVQSLYPQIPAQQGPGAQVIILTEPKVTQDPETVRRRQKASKISGIILVSHAVIVLILGIVMAVFSEAKVGTPAYLTFIVSLTTGCLCLGFGLKGSKCCLVAALVMTIITSVVAGSCFISSLVFGIAYSFDEHDMEYFRHRYLVSIMFGITALLHLTVTVTCIVQSGYACAHLCRCCRPNDPMQGARLAYVGQRDQSGQVVLTGGQPLPVMDIGRQTMPATIVVNT